MENNIEDNPEEALVDLASAKVNQLIDWHRLDDALEEAMKPISEFPENADGYALIAKVQYAMNQYNSALHWCSEALQRDPENSWAWFVKVRCYFDQSDWINFDPAIKSAIAIEPDEPSYYFFLAARKHRLGKYHEAKEQGLIALELNPNNPLYLACLCLLEACLDNFEASLELEDAALQYNADLPDPYVYVNLSRASFWRGDEAHGMKLLEAALELAPDSKLVRDDYFYALRNKHPLYRLVLWNSILFKKVKLWQYLLIWLAVALVFRWYTLIFPAVLLLTAWGSKKLVQAKVYQSYNQRHP